MVPSQSETFQVIPAVDILGAEAVRLLRGDYDEVTLREADPFALIRRVAAAGAEIVHVVDLSAARAGGVHPELVARSVAAAAPVPVQAAGGVRTTSDAAELVAVGAERIVVGTAAFSDSSLLDELVRELGERLVVAIDVRAGTVAVDGWTQGTSFSVPDAVERATRAGASRLLCTAIERDGTLGGPSLDLLAEVCALSGLPVLAAGGIRSPDDLRAIEAVGCEGAIVGRALLEGLVPLTALGRKTDE
ncbi:MAG: 1-(5-phosphoribosyl)-5-[(5-phosphoribosylamino)methylideneamino] imidazole-4-carboxamide isomerase [Gaiellaceae bacterium]